jgi:hypothetical protein
MFYMWSISLGTCHGDQGNGEQDASKPIDWTCNLSSSYSQTFSILITSNWSFLDDEAEGFQTIISYAFAFIVGILLLNILIAIISDAFSEIERRGDLEYWKYRLNFEHETQRAYTVVLSCVRPIKQTLVEGSIILMKKDKAVPARTISQAPKRGLGKKSISVRDYFFTKDLEEPDEVQPRISFSDDSFITYEKLSGIDIHFFFQWWFDRDSGSHTNIPPPLKIRLWYFFKRASYEEIIYPGKTFENVVMGIKYNEEGSGESFVITRLFTFLLIFVNTIIMIGVFLLGLVTFGLCWPGKIRERLFFGPTIKKNDEMTKLKSEIDCKFSKAHEEVVELHDTVEKMFKNQEDLLKNQENLQAQVSELITLLKKSQDK